MQTAWKRCARFGRLSSFLISEDYPRK
jgi:hypothetical protein